VLRWFTLITNIHTYCLQIKKCDFIYNDPIGTMKTCYLTLISLNFPNYQVTRYRVTIVFSNSKLFQQDEGDMQKSQRNILFKYLKGTTSTGCGLCSDRIHNVGNEYGVFNR
jgi:hypothetical protein